MSEWFSGVSGERVWELEQIRAGAGGVCFLVGGFVRDRLLGLAPDDFDVVIEGDAVGLARELVRAHGGEAVVHPPFGTATWRSPGGLSYDLVSARREAYPAPAVLPTVTVGAGLTEDLGRRDFTVNAMALALTGGAPDLRDPLGGEVDLRRGVIRALHPRSFVDDPTRLFRAVRYEQRYGFSIEPETLGWMAAGRAALPALSADRVRHEVTWIVAEPRAGAMLARLQALGLWGALAPELGWNARAAAGWAAWEAARADLLGWVGLTEARHADLTVALALAGAGEQRAEVLHRFNVSRDVRHGLLAAWSLGSLPARASQIVVVLDSLGALGLVAGWAVHPAWRPAIERYGREWRNIHPRTTGADLIARGLRPGPDFGRLLTGLRAALLDGAISTPEDEQAWLERHHAGG